ncbi:MAG: hypothetical protein JWM16_6149, partial [Verrucomicrobiales bacterium]|nr:hypothetical protein [Verrucomicrobiales bacterium]
MNRIVAGIGSLLESAGRTLRGAKVERRVGPMGPNATGVFVTPDRAMCLTPVYAAISTLSRDLAALPLSSWQKTPGGK